MKDKPTTQVKQNVLNSSSDDRYQHFYKVFHADPIEGHEGNLEMLLYANEVYFIEWQTKFVQLLKEQTRFDDLKWDQFYQNHINALHYYQNKNQTNEASLMMISLKLKALENSYQEVVKGRYINALHSQRHLDDQGLQRLCNKLLAENHPDRYQGKSPENIKRQEMRFAALNNLSKELKDPLLQDRELAKVDQLKEWLLTEAQQPGAQNNQSLRFAAQFVREKGLGSSERLAAQLQAQSSRFNGTVQEIMAERAVAPTVTPAQLALRKQEQTLKNLAKVLEEKFYLNQEDFKKDQVSPLIWNVLLTDKNLIKRCSNPNFTFRIFAKDQLKEKIEVALNPRYPWLVKAYDWTKEHCRCPLDDLAQKKPEYTLTDEERFLLSLLSSYDWEFKIEYYEIPKESNGPDVKENNKPAASTSETHLNTALLDDLELRDLAWELIATETKRYNTGISYYKDLEGFHKQINFIYAGIRRGGLSLNLLYRDLIVPMKQLIQDLENQLKPENSADQKEQDKTALIPEEAIIITERIEQLHIVLSESKALIHQELRTLVAMPRITHGPQLLENEHQHQQFISQLYKKIAHKIEKDASSEKIGKHRNTIGPMLMGLLGVVTGIALISTGIGALAWTSKIFRISFRQTFFDTRTQSRLRECEKRLLRDQEKIQKVSRNDIYHLLEDTNYFPPPPKSGM
jgi:hypothetical protein